MTTIQNIFILLRCYLYALVRGTARKRITDPKRVCIIQTAQIGDMVCTTPMFRAVKNKYPTAKVFVVGTAINEEVLRGNPDVDEYLVWKGGFNEMAKKLKSFEYDFACTTSPNFTGLAALYLAGVPSIAAPRIMNIASPYETRSYKLLRPLACIIPYRIGEYMPLQYLRLLEPVGVTSTDTAKHLRYSPAGLQVAESVLTEKGITGQFAIVAPGAGGKIKTWAPERFARVAEHIAGRMPVAVIGSQRDAAEVKSLRSSLKVDHGSIFDFSEKFSMDELKAFISKASLFISGDTGPIYIAEAFGVLTIDIVGPVAEDEQPPRGERHLVVVPKRLAPAIHIMSASVYDAQEAKRQAEASSAEEVIEAADLLLEKS